jgi:hypothetical protein
MADERDAGEGPDLQKTLFRNMNRFVKPLVKAGLGSPRPVGLGAVVLETTGRTSGQHREVPVLGVRVGDRLVVSTVRSRSQWVKTLEADDRAAVWFCGRRHPAHASVQRGPLNTVTLDTATPDTASTDTASTDTADLDTTGSDTTTDTTTDTTATEPIDREPPDAG